MIAVRFTFLGDLTSSRKRYFPLSKAIGAGAGREDKKGRAFLQTYAPQNGVLKALITGDMTELEKMKEIMPEAYEIYMQMIAGEVYAA